MRYAKVSKNKHGKETPGVATVTSKGQTTIPKSVRDHLRLKPGDRIEFIIQEDGQVIVVPATADLNDLEGVLPPPKDPVSLEAMEEAIKRRIRL